MISALKSTNILYVEDDESIRRPFSKILNLAFNEVNIATNGKEALDMLNKFKEEGYNVDCRDASNLATARIHTWPLDA